MVSAQWIDVRNVEFLHFSNEPICHFEHFCTMFLVTTDTFKDESKCATNYLAIPTAAASLPM
jgi:hypothetical protein